MGNIFSIIAKYGPMLAKYASYIKYLPLLAGLVEFVRTAQREFSEQGSGAQKAAWAEAKFVELVTMVESVGMIKPRFAEFLRKSAATLVKAIVEWYRDAEGEVPPAPPVVEPKPFPYGELLTTDPDRSRLKPGDEIYQHSSATKWIVWGGIGPVPKAASGWSLIFTVPQPDGV